MENKKLTQRQSDVLEFIRQFIREAGCPPTIREIARHFRFSSLRTVQCHLEGLTKKGALRFRSARPAGKGGGRGHRLARGLRLAEGLGGFPLLGRVPAGAPVWESGDVEATVDLNDMFPAKFGYYALRIKGDSMSGAGILDGDLVLVRAQTSAQPNDIVVALVDGEATVKRFAREKNETVLAPANPKYTPIPVTPAVQISGKVMGVLRKYGT
ncbi:MAG: transcriptional repressor LexA [Elusimicrobiota bacterium]|jgi:repressor LexA